MRAIADYHTHTSWSHARGSVADNVRAGREAGLKELGIAEHGPRLLFVGVPLGRWPALARTVREYSGGDIKVLFNIEANIISTEGDLDLPGTIADELDMLLVGLHPRVVPKGLEGYWSFYGLRWLALLSRSKRHLLYDTFTCALVNCVERHEVDLVVHPGYGLPIDTGELARACARRGTCLEINCKHTETSAKDIEIAGRSSDVRFIISSDAHYPRDIGRFQAGYDLVRRLGLDRERIVNVDWQDNGR